MDLSEIREHSGRRHPWEIARAGAFARIVVDVLDLPEPVDWLDIGSGDAYTSLRLLHHLPKGSTLACVDIDYDDAFLTDPANQRDGVTYATEPPDATFDVISMLDVLEHIEDDQGFLGDVVDSHLAPGGTVLVSVPMYQALFTTHDTALRHYRRYSRSSLRRVTPPSLRARREGGLFLSLLPIRSLQKLMELLRPKRALHSEGEFGIGAWNGGTTLTRVLSVMLGLDVRFCLTMSRWGVPIPGLSHWVVYEDAR